MSRAEHGRRDYEANSPQSASSGGELLAAGTPHPKFLWRFKYEGTPQGDPGAEDQWHCLICDSEQKLQAEGKPEEK